MSESKASECRYCNGVEWAEMHDEGCAYYTFTRHAPNPTEPRMCPAPLAYRDMSDIGSKRTCGNPASSSGFCKRHNPETAPKRDAKGRILPNEPRVVAECWTCNAPPPGRYRFNGAVHVLRKGGKQPERPDCRAAGHDVRDVKGKP